MCLPSTQVDQFYKIWPLLLNFVNEHLKVVPSLSSSGPEGILDVQNAIQIRDVLWKNVEVLDEFIASHPAQLSADDLSILDSWRYRRQGSFIVFKALKKHAIFISQDKKGEVYTVKGLKSSMEEMFPFLPIMVEGVLLPFHDDIITDGLFRTYNITFGSGIRARLKGAYDDAKERGAILTSLLPKSEMLTPESQIAKIEATNDKVLEAFPKYQYEMNLSAKTIERDLTAVRAFGQALLAGRPNPRSLRDFGEEDLRTYLRPLPASAQKSARMSLKRFIAFLRDSERLSWGEAGALLNVVG